MLNQFDELKNLIQTQNLIINSKRVEIKAKTEELDTLFLFCKENLGYEWLTDIVVYDLGEDQFKLSYSLKNPENGNCLLVSIEINKNEEIKSTASIWKHGEIFEKEAFEMFGVKFDYDIKRYLFEESFLGHPLLKSFTNFEQNDYIKEREQFDIFLSPKFPLAETDLDFHFNLSNDVIIKSHIELGYFHFGLEKNLENKSIQYALQRIGALSSRTSAVWTMAFADLVERGLEIEIPSKAMGIRMILNEFTRIKNHLYTLITMTHQCEYEDLLGHLIIWYKQTLDQIKKLTLSNNSSRFITIGGVKSDLPVGWVANCVEYLGKFEKELMLEYRFFTKNSFYYDRLQCGEISRDEAMNWAITGPVLRSCGINYDLRKRKPNYFYEDVSFEVPVGVNGRIYDRFLVYIEEIFQSVKILAQVLDNIPTGKTVSEEVTSIYHFQKEEAKIINQDEYRSSLHFLSNRELASSWTEWEGPSGLIQLNASFENQLINRLKISSSGQNLVSLFQSEVIGEKLEDAELLWCSLGINLSEVEK